MSTYFFVIFEVHYTIFGYNVCFEENMDLSPRLTSGTTSKDTKQGFRTRSGSQKNLNNSFTYSSIHGIGYILSLTKDLR